MAEAGRSKTARPRATIRPGTRVEVQTAFDGSWQEGFVVEAATDAGYVLRRLSDDAVLPPIAPDRVRRPRSRQTWWV